MMPIRRAAPLCVRERPWGRTREAFSGLPGFTEVVSGLSTGESLKFHVRDPRYEKQYNKKTKKTEVVLVDAGVDDKRLPVIEPEFARVLRQQFRTGNTLSPTTREAWDTGQPEDPDEERSGQGYRSAHQPPFPQRLAEAVILVVSG
jgi:hypothetical protein